MGQRNSLLVEDAGLLQRVLALRHVPHPDCPVAAAGGQQAFLTAPAAGDDLREDQKSGAKLEPAAATGGEEEATDPALVRLQLDEGALPQIPRHVGEGLRLALAVVAVVGGQRADQLLRSPLAVLGGEPGGQAAGCQSVGQLQGAYSGGIMGRMGI